MKVLLFLCWVFLAACSTLQKPFLYEVKKPSDSFYLFGTIHLGVPVQDIPPVVMDKFYASQTFEMEMDAGSVESERRFLQEIQTTSAEFSAILNSLHKSNPDAATRLGKRLKLNYLKRVDELPEPGKKLSQRLTPRAWKYARAYFKQVDLQTLEKVSPGTVVSFLYAVQPVEVEAAPNWFLRMDPKRSMDLNLHSLAQQQGKAIYQLDDADVFSPECADQVASVQIVSFFEKKERQDLVQEFSILEKAYRAGDGDEVLRSSTRSEPELSACMLNERNKKWIPRLISDSGGVAMRGQPPLFVAVGAAHLFGPEGLLNLLVTEGYTWRRIEP